MADSMPRLLFISPALPRQTGNGLAMRAHSVLRVLAERHRIHLLAGSRYFPCRPRDISQELFELCERITCLTSHLHKDPAILFRAVLHRFAPELYYRMHPRPWEYFPLTIKVRKTLDKIAEGEQIDLIHIFRLYMFPVGDFFLQRNPSATCHLDLDDVESETRRRIGALYRLSGNRKMADRTMKEANLFEAIEKSVLPRCNRVFVCSEMDREKLSGMYQLNNVGVLPNTVKLPEPVHPRYRSDNGFTFLFVGSMLYYPNNDAVLFFCCKVLPILRTLTTRTVLFKVIGGGAGREIIRATEKLGGVELEGHVPNIASFYEGADAVVVPIRAGGGTRIKVLEAFAYLRPVISTRVGIEGIDAQHEIHALVADGAQEFAVQCARIVSDDGLGSKLVENAFQLLRTKHHPDVIRDSLFDPDATTTEELSTQ